MILPIPLPVLYAGLGGVLLALIVATAQNRWQPRVFCLLALRLAIGWHFCFEGLHKVHSHMIGDTDVSKPFTSANYFNIGDGPGAEIARKQFISDPEQTYTERLLKKKEVAVVDFRKLSIEQQSELCPDAVANLLKVDDSTKAQAAKAKYAGWVYGAEPRNAKFKDISGDTPVTPEQYLDYIAMLQKEYTARVERTKLGLGKGNGLEVKRTAAIKADLNAVKADLAKATDEFVNELKKEAGVKEETAPIKRIVLLDQITLWSITAIGIGLLLGLFTRLWCLAGIGFLAMTYLNSPPWPWLPPPPPSEGNPLFINKNMIEAIGLLVVMVHPTGRWLGLDAIIDYVLFGARKK
jgi:uncharacterized membrane protein YphA (DoxX/SURF4 family)